MTFQESETFNILRVTKKAKEVVKEGLALSVNYKTGFIASKRGEGCIVLLSLFKSRVLQQSLGTRLYY